jgi:hypothetical protein
LQRHGSRPRSYIRLGQKQFCQVDRFFCPDCHKYFTRLPPFLLPYKRYTADEIESALQYLADGGSLSRTPGEADESTLRIWLKEFRGKMRDWTGQLESILLRLKQRIASVIRLPLNPFHRLQSILAEYPILPSHWTLLVKALHWLQKSYPHCLG